jgi:hypothetical protein
MSDLPIARGLMESFDNCIALDQLHAMSKCIEEVH